jgi:inorganic pyrophosphatase
MNLAAIPAFASTDIFHVVIETPRGSSLKLKYEPQWEAMSISRPLPLGVIYPFDWGFIPSTHAEDGDPVDAMVLWDVPSYPGVVLRVRAIGILQVEQNQSRDRRSPRVRNDRVVVVPVDARRENSIDSVDALPERVRQELEQFAVASTALEGKDIRVVGWGDAAATLALVRDCSRLYPPA